MPVWVRRRLRVWGRECQVDSEAGEVGLGGGRDRLGGGEDLLSLYYPRPALRYRKVPDVCAGRDAARLSDRFTAVIRGHPSVAISSCIPDRSAFDDMVANLGNGEEPSSRDTKQYFLSLQPRTASRGDTRRACSLANPLTMVPEVARPAQRMPRREASITLSGSELQHPKGLRDGTYA